MWKLEHKESWAPKNWCFWTVVLEETLASPLDCKKIQPVHPKGDQSWVFIGSTDVEAETPILWPPDVKSWLIWKDPDAGKDWGQEEKGTTEDEMAGWHHQLDGRESEWTPGVGDGQGGLECCSSWGRKESDITERLKWTELNWNSFHEVYSRNFIYFLDIENGLFSSIIPWIIIICINESCWFLHIDSALLYVLIASSGFTISCIGFFQIYNHYHLGVFY